MIKNKANKQIILIFEVIALTWSFKKKGQHEEYTHVEPKEDRFLWPYPWANGLKEELVYQMVKKPDTILKKSTSKSQLRTVAHLSTVKLAEP